MALYWPEEKVALDIVDDPMRRPFEGDDSYTVLRVTSADLYDYDSCHKIMERLCVLLGRKMPTAPDWEQDSRGLYAMLSDWSMWGDDFPDESDYIDDDVCEEHDDPLDNVEIIAASEREAEQMRLAAEREGRTIRGVTVWEGPTPKDSFELLPSGVRMSTPEFFFLRKANQLSFPKAVQLGVELCGKYRSRVTQYNADDGYDFLSQTRTSKARIRRYLRGARGTREYKHAKRVLRHVAEDCSSPMGCYLHLLVSLTPSQGGYGVEQAILSGAFEGKESFLPSADGPYLAYDLCWPNKRVALQYTGARQPPKRAAAALNADRMRTFCVTDDDVEDPQRFDAIVRKLAKALQVKVPEADDKAWLASVRKLRREIPMPTYECMRLTIDDISEHHA